MLRRGAHGRVREFLQKPSVIPQGLFPFAQLFVTPAYIKIPSRLEKAFPHVSEPLGRIQGILVISPALNRLPRRVELMGTSEKFNPNKKRFDFIQHSGIRILRSSLPQPFG
jgi:hypothetical protein